MRKPTDAPEKPVKIIRLVRVRISQVFDDNSEIAVQESVTEYEGINKQNGLDIVINVGIPGNFKINVKDITYESRTRRGTTD